MLSDCCLRICATSLMQILSLSWMVSIALTRSFSQGDTLIWGGKLIYFFILSMRVLRWSVFSQGNKLYRIL